MLNMWLYRMRDLSDHENTSFYLINIGKIGAGEGQGERGCKIDKFSKSKIREIKV